MCVRALSAGMDDDIDEQTTIFYLEVQSCVCAPCPQAWTMI